MKIKGLKLKEVNNGWQVEFFDETKGGEYVYPSTHLIMMVEALAKFILGYKVRVIDGLCTCGGNRGTTEEISQADSTKAE